MFARYQAALTFPVRRGVQVRYYQPTRFGKLTGHLPRWTVTATAAEMQPWLYHDAHGSVQLPINMEAELPPLGGLIYPSEQAGFNLRLSLTTAGSLQMRTFLTEDKRLLTHIFTPTGECWQVLDEEGNDTIGGTANRL